MNDTSDRDNPFEEPPPAAKKGDAADGAQSSELREAAKRLRERLEQCGVLDKSGPKNWVRIERRPAEDDDKK